MPRQSLLHPPVANRRQPLLPNPGGETDESTAAAAARTTTGGRVGVAEAAGRTAADCTVLCCCCPCTVVNLLALAVYRVPAGLCRRVRRRRQRSVAAKRKKKGGLLAQRPSSFAPGAVAAAGETVADLLKAEKEGADAAGSDSDSDEEAVHDLEKEMWERFHGAGFWRSPSMRAT